MDVFTITRLNYVCEFRMTRCTKSTALPLPGRERNAALTLRLTRSIFIFMKLQILKLSIDTLAFESISQISNQFFVFFEEVNLSDRHFVDRHDKISHEANFTTRNSRFVLRSSNVISLLEKESNFFNELFSVFLFIFFF